MVKLNKDLDEAVAQQVAAFNPETDAAPAGLIAVAFSDKGLALMFINNLTADAAYDEMIADGVVDARVEDGIVYMAFTSMLKKDPQYTVEAELYFNEVQARTLSEANCITLIDWSDLPN